MVKIKVIVVERATVIKDTIMIITEDKYGDCDFAPAA